MLIRVVKVIIFKCILYFDDLYFKFFIREKEGDWWGLANVFEAFRKFERLWNLSHTIFAIAMLLKHDKFMNLLYYQLTFYLFS